MEKIRTTSFWIGLSSAIVIVLDTLSKIFGFTVFSHDVECVVMGICSLLVVVGFINKKSVNEPASSKSDLLDDLKNSLGDDGSSSEQLSVFENDKNSAIDKTLQSSSEKRVNAESKCEVNKTSDDSQSKSIDSFSKECDHGKQTNSGENCDEEENEDDFDV